MSNELIPVRLSHVLGQSGVGAIVRGAKGLVVVQDIRHWNDQQGDPAGRLIPYVERVRAALGNSPELREPPIAKELANGQVDGACVPATRFPGWMRCPNPRCGALYQRPWMDAGIEDPSDCRCSRCESKPQLEQVTWVLAHEAGYLADVPWHFLAHRDPRSPTQQACKVRDRLRLIDRGYERRELRCDAANCGSKAKFYGDERLPFGQQRMQPWTRDDLAPVDTAPKDDAEEGAANLAQVVTIDDTRAYSPEYEVVLIIPPESRVRKGTVVDLLYRNSAERKKLDNARTPLQKRSVIKTLSTEYRCTPADIEAALSDLDRGYPLYGENLTPGQLRESEFDAFLEILPDQRDDEDLVTRNRSEQWHALPVADGLTEDAKALVTSIEHLVRVDRLKAIKVFRGFTRLGAEDAVPPDIVGQSDWWPAIELYGEGIFIALEEAKLQQWEQQAKVLARLEKIQLRYAGVKLPCREQPNPLTARFMLLHTLSHLLMRQIESEGGYPAASLIERIYCAQAPLRMAGILIHVAVPDIAGSLGGLAELAEPKKFLGILSRALEHARWCSLDPVCSEHDGQGPGLLNRAACHACTLVPEPTCEYGNTLLDRGFIKGDDKDGLPAFFGAS